MKNINYLKAKKDITASFLGVIELFGIMVVTSALSSVLTGLIPLVGIIAALALGAFMLPITTVVYDSVYIKNEGFDLPNVFKRLLYFWSSKAPQIIMLTIMLYVKCFIVGFILILILGMTIAGSILFASAAALIVGIILFALMFVLLSSFQFKYQYKLTALYYGKTDNNYMAGESYKIVLKMTLWNIVPFVGWIMTICKTYIYNLKLVYDVLDNEESKLDNGFNPDDFNR